VLEEARRDKEMEERSTWRGEWWSWSSSSWNIEDWIDEVDEQEECKGEYEDEEIERPAGFAMHQKPSSGLMPWKDRGAPRRKGAMYLKSPFVVVVQCEGGRQVLINASRLSTMIEVKRKLADVLDIDTGRQVVRVYTDWFPDGVEVDDDDTLSSAGFEPNDVMRFELKKDGRWCLEEFEIYMKDRESLSVFVRSDEIVEKLKEKVQGLTRMAVARQSFSFGGKEMEDHRSIGSYGVSRGSTIMLSLKFGG